MVSEDGRSRQSRRPLGELLGHRDFAHAQAMKAIDR
jgi:hypothetical protein